MALLDVLKKIKEVINDAWTEDDDEEQLRKKKKKKKKTKLSSEQVASKKGDISARKDAAKERVSHDIDSDNKSQRDKELYSPEQKTAAKNEQSKQKEGVTESLPPPPAGFSNRFADKKAGFKNLSSAPKGGMAKILEKKPSEVEKKFVDGGLKAPKTPTSENVAKDPSLVYLVRGKDRGRAAWHYVLVKRNLLPIFLKHTQGGTVDVAKFGSILFSGWGEDPPPEIVEKINRGEY